MRRRTLPYLALALLFLALAPSFARAAPFIRSDVNQNGRLDLADPLRALEHLLLGAARPGCPDALDANDDGVTDVSDVIYPLVFLFLEGPPPPAPYPDCGEDPTDDDLGCVRSRVCPPRVANIREALGNCGGVPRSEYPNSLVRGDDLHRVTLDDAKAVCNDGSPGVMYVRSAPADGPHVDRWVFYLQGGGSCSSAEECMARWCGIGTIYDESKMSSRYNPESIGGTGIFRRGDDNAFGDFNQVFLYYCSSDSWVGRASDSVLADADEPTRQFSMHFRGHSIIVAALRALLPGGLESDDRQVVMPPLETAETALLAGFSAGSGGALHNGDWFASVLERNGTAVRLVRDAGLTPPADAHPDPAEAAELDMHLELAHRHEWENVFSSDLYDGFVDESCRAALDGTGEEWRCVDKTYVSFNHITTPYFVHLDLGNRGSRIHFEEEFGVDPETFAVMTRTVMLRLADVPDAALESDAITRAPGVMGTLCGDHVGLTSDSIFYGRTVDDATGTPRSYHDALVTWLEGTDVSVIDDPDNPTTVCGERQPEKE